MNNLSNTLRQLRLQKGYSQEYMASQIGISQSAYARIENDCTPLTLKRLQKIATVLGTSLSLLVNPKNSNPETEKDLAFYKTLLLEKDKHISKLEETITLLKDILGKTA